MWPCLAGATVGACVRWSSLLFLLAQPPTSQANLWAYSMEEYISPTYASRLYGGLEVWGSNTTGGSIPTATATALNNADGVYWYVRLCYVPVCLCYIPRASRSLWVQGHAHGRRPRTRVHACAHGNQHDEWHGNQHMLSTLPGGGAHRMLLGGADPSPSCVCHCHCVLCPHSWGWHRAWMVSPFCTPTLYYREHGAGRTSLARKHPLVLENCCGTPHTELAGVLTAPVRAYPPNSPHPTRARTTGFFPTAMRLRQ